jgi:hypothetical protein
MVERLRDDLDALEVAVAAVAEATGIPAAHVEKDFWLTEALRGVAAAADRLGVPVYFKGGTSLSKVFGLIRRFSEDADLLAVLRADDSPGRRHGVLKQLCAGAVEATGLEETPVGDKSSKGERRAITLAYPTTQSLQPLRHEGVLVETFTRAAGLPSRGRPREGFAASEAFDPDEPANEVTRGAYDTVVLGSLLWADSPRPTFKECCDAVRDFPTGL